MSVEIVIPQLPDSVTHAQIQSINVAEGQLVSVDQPLLDVETEKVVLEVVAPYSGTIQNIQVQVGDNVTSGQVTMFLEPDAAAEQSAPVINATEADVENIHDDASTNHTPQQRSEILSLTLWGIASTVLIALFISLFLT